MQDKAGSPFANITKTRPCKTLQRRDHCHLCPEAKSKDILPFYLKTLFVFFLFHPVFIFKELFIYFYITFY